MVATESTSAPLIVVFGSTGVQGGSVVNHLIASKKEYRIKGVTRDPSKPNGQKLKERGVEPIKVDLSSVESISQAIKGADYVFAVTNFWESGSEGELKQGASLIEALKSASPQPVFIWSGLPDSSKISGGKYSKVEHFDNKAKIYEDAQSAGLQVLDVEPAGYMENYTTMMAPRKQEDGSFALALPMKENGKVAVINCGRDYGAFVVAAIEAGMKSGRVLASTDEISCEQIVQAIAQASGKDVKFVSVPDEAFASQAGEELTQMLAYFNEFGYYGGESTKKSQDLVKTDTQSWKEFASSHDWSKVLA